MIVRSAAPRRAFRTLAQAQPSFRVSHEAPVEPQVEQKTSSMSYALPGNAAFSPRLRKSPFYTKTLEAGVADFTSYNRMLMPLGFGDPAGEYEALTQGVSMWDVAAERQVELRGADAHKLAQLMTCRDISNLKAGVCAYAIMCDDAGVVINDPLLIKLSEQRYWFSIADSDVLLWAKGLALGRGLDVSVIEPDVSPLAVQGPRSRDVMRKLFGAEVVDDLKYFHVRRGKATMLDGAIPVTLARSGWSPELGYELYLEDSKWGGRLWDMVAEAGAEYGIVPGAPNQQRRVEAGMLSFGGDTLPDTNALELGLPRKMCDPFMTPEFIGKAALQRIAHREGGPRRRFCGIRFDAGLAPGLFEDWIGQHLPVYLGNQRAGSLTAQAFSPLFGQHLGLGFMDSALQDGAPVTVYSSTGASMPGEISSLPFRGESVEGGRDVRKNKPAAPPTQAASGAETGGYPRNTNSWET